MRVRADSITEVQWTNLTVDNDKLFPRAEKVARTDFEEAKRILEKGFGGGAVAEVKKYQKAIADAEKQFVIDEAKELADQVERTNKAQNDFSDDTSKVENRDRERDSDAQSKYRTGRTTDRLRALGGDPALVQPPANGGGVNASSIKSTFSHSSQFVSVPELGGGVTSTLLSPEARRERDYQLSVAAADLIYLRTLTQAQAAFERSVSQAIESVTHYYSEDRKSQAVVYAAATAENARQMSYAIADLQESRDLAIIDSSTQISKNINLLIEDMKIALMDAGGVYKNKRADARAAQVESIVTAEIGSYGSVLTSNSYSSSGFANPAGSSSLRAAKENAAEMYLTSEYNYALANGQSQAIAMVDYAVQLRLQQVSLSQALGVANVTFAQVSNQAHVAYGDAGILLDVQNDLAMRTYANAEEDFDWEKAHSRFTALNRAAIVFAHASGAATTERTQIVSEALGTSVSTLFQERVDSVNTLYLSHDNSSRQAEYMTATADAQADWIALTKPAYVTYATSLVVADLVQIYADLESKDINDEAGWATKDDYRLAVRSLGDVKDAAKYHARQVNVLKNAEANWQFAVDVSQADAGYATGKTEADASLYIKELHAFGVKTLSRISKMSSLDGAYSQLLDFSKDLDGGGVVLDVGAVTLSGNTYTALSSPSDGLEISPEKQEELSIAAGRVTRAIQVASVFNTYSEAVANASKLQQQSVAKAKREMQNSVALADRDFTLGQLTIIKSQRSANEATLSSSRSAKIVAANENRIARTTADNAWMQASLNSKVAALSNVAQQMQLPWTDYQALKAEVEALWWSESGAPLALELVQETNLINTSYQVSENADYHILTLGAANLESQRMEAITSAAFQQSIDNAIADEEFDFASATAAADWLKASGSSNAGALISHYTQQQAVAQSSNGLAGIVSLDDGRSIPLSISTSATGDQIYDQTISLAKRNQQLSRLAADATFHQAATVGKSSNLSGDIELQHAFQQATSTLAMSKESDLIALQNAHDLALAATLASRMTQLATNHSSPWAALDAAVAVAEANYKSTSSTSEMLLKQEILAADHAQSTEFRAEYRALATSSIDAEKARAVQEGDVQAVLIYAAWSSGHSCDIDEKTFFAAVEEGGGEGSLPQFSNVEDQPKPDKESLGIKPLPISVFMSIAKPVAVKIEPDKQDDPNTLVDDKGQWTAAGVYAAYEKLYGDNEKEMRTFFVVLSEYRLEIGDQLWMREWLVDHENRIIYIAPRDNFGWNLRTNEAAAIQLNQIMYDVFYEIAGLGESWEGATHRVVGGGLKVVGGVLTVVGGGALILAPEPTMLTKVGGYGAAVFGTNTAIDGATQVVRREGGVNLIGEAAAAYGGAINGEEGAAASRYWIGWSEFTFNLAGGLGGTSLAKMPIQSIPAATSQSLRAMYERAKLRFGGPNSIPKPVDDILNGGNSDELLLPRPTHPNAHGFSIRDVNPTGNTYNCGECSIIVDDILASGGRAGRAAAPILPNEMLNAHSLERIYRSQFSEISKLGDVANDMQMAGNGSRGIVFGIKEGADHGHFFNVVNQGGELRYLCGQTGGSIDPSKYFVFRLLRTNK